MALLISFKDAVNAAVLDPAATVAVFYCDGRYENRASVAARCPHAKLYAITVRGATGPGIFACDSETGDLTIAQTVDWVAEQTRLAVYPIVAYADEDRWVNLGLLAALAKYGDRIERWDADYDGSPVLPSWASAKQFMSTDVDLDSARADFFTGATPAPDYHYERYREGAERVAAQRYDHWRVRQTATAHPHRAWMLVRKRQCRLYRRRIELAVAWDHTHHVSDPWSLKCRRFRHQQLGLRAQGKRAG